MWVATFDWLLKPDTATRVLEGQYDNRASAPKPQPFYLAGPKSHMDWFDECKRVHDGKCEDSNRHANRMFADAEKAATA